jgi:predicted small secreted protein
MIQSSMETPMRLFAIIAMLLVNATVLSACNLFEGAGEDLQVGGKKLERTANENKGTDSRGY